MDDRPLLFISHRHKNDEIVRVLYDFLRQRTLGKVDLFCSSRAEAAPAPGSMLNAELREKLADARALALIYTTDDEDWSYCMYECGLATDPRTPKTRIIVFQCSGDVPTVFSDVVRVNVHDQESVKTFVIMLLTNPDFFHGLEKAIAPDFQPESPAVDAIAEELGTLLRNAAPPPKAKPDDEWPSFDSMTLEVMLDVVEKIKSSDVAQNEKSNLIREQAVVKKTDLHCPRLFGMPNIPLGTSLGTVVDQWRAANPNASDKWSDELVRQVQEASAWRFPKVRWVPMSVIGRKDRYVPGIHYVRRIPSSGCLEFDIYFLPILKSGVQDPQDSSSADRQVDVQKSDRALDLKRMSAVQLRSVCNSYHIKYQNKRQATDAILDVEFAEKP